MARTYPTGADLRNYLISAGLIKDVADNTMERLGLDVAIAAAVDEWERDVKWFPFLSNGTQDEARQFDIPQNDQLILNAGVLTISSLTVYDTPMAQEQQFTLQRTQGQPPGVGYDWVRLRARWNNSGRYFPGGLGGTGYYPASAEAISRPVVITGEWGLYPADTLPADVFDSLCAKAASRLAPRLGVKKTGGLVSWTEADTTQRFGESPFGAFQEQCDEQYKASADLYRRKPVSQFKRWSGQQMS